MKKYLLFLVLSSCVTPEGKFRGLAFARLKDCLGYGTPYYNRISETEKQQCIKDSVDYCTAHNLDVACATDIIWTEPLPLFQYH